MVGVREINMGNGRSGEMNLNLGLTLSLTLLTRMLLMICRRPGVPERGKAAAVVGPGAIAQVMIPLTAMVDARVRREGMSQRTKSTSISPKGLRRRYLFCSLLLFVVVCFHSFVCVRAAF